MFTKIMSVLFVGLMASSAWAQDFNIQAEPTSAEATELQMQLKNADLAFRSVFRIDAPLAFECLGLDAIARGVDLRAIATDLEQKARWQEIFRVFERNKPYLRSALSAVQTYHHILKVKTDCHQYTL